MELEVRDHRGIPDTGLLSISIGGTRRQVQISQQCRTLRFPGKVEDMSQIKVDVLKSVGRGRVPCSMDSGPETQYKVSIDAEDGSAMEVDLIARLASGEPANPTQEEINGQRANREVMASNYLEEHGLVNFMQFLLTSLMKDKPVDPYSFLQKQLALKTGKQGDSPVDGLLDRLKPEEACKGSALELSKLESEALEAGQRLRSDNADLRRTASQLKGEYDKLMKESSFLHNKLDAKHAAKEAIAHPTILPFKNYYGRFVLAQCRPHYWNKLHRQFTDRVEPTPLGAAEKEAKTRAAYREIEKLQEEVAALARENAKLVSDLARGREMIEMVRKDIDEIRTSVENDPSV